MRWQQSLFARRLTAYGITARGRRAALLAAVAITAAALPGCASRERQRGDLVEAERLQRVVPNVHTRNDVVALLGSPSTIAPFDGEAWYYISSTTKAIAFLPSRETDRQVVVVRFNGQGVVNDVETFGIERGEEVAFTDRVTPTFGTDLNAMEQFMSNLGRFNREETERR